MKHFFTIVIIFIMVLTVRHMQTNTYEAEAIAIDNHTLETADGNLWEVTDNLEKGNEYTVKFFDNRTPSNIYDDIIYDIILR